jgi:small ligand-binding sensory domain FIST
MEPSFGRSRMVAFDHFAVEIHGEKFVLRDLIEADPRRHQEKIRIKNAGADMTKSLNQFLMREDAAGADNIFFKLAV